MVGDLFVLEEHRKRGKGSGVGGVRGLHPLVHPLLCTALCLFVSFHYSYIERKCYIDNDYMCVRAKLHEMDT